MIRAVIDTNVLVSAFSTHNPDSPTIRIYYLSPQILMAFLLLPTIFT